MAFIYIFSLIKRCLSVTNNHNQHHDCNNEKEIESIRQRIQSLPIGGDIIMRTLIDGVSSDHKKSAKFKRDSFRKSIMESSQKDSIDSIDYEELNELNAGTTPQISCNQM
jgi:hypothetical protein